MARAWDLRIVGSTYATVGKMSLKCKGGNPFQSSISRFLDGCGVAPQHGQATFASYLGMMSTIDKDL
jgi:hypothetical protein